MTRIRIRARARCLAVAALLPLALGLTQAVATEAEDLAAGELRGSSGAEERKSARQAELEAIRRSIEVSERRQNALREEIAELESDRAKLSADLIATAQRLRRSEDEIRRIEARLDELHANEDVIRASLRERRGTMAEVIMALQRMGRTPPPALLSRPEDALATIRGSILAGAVLPDIRREAEALAADLAELTQVSAQIQSERDALRSQYAALGEERARIDLLVATKQAQRDQTASALSAEQARAAELANEAETTQALIEKLENESAAAARAKAEAEQVARVTAPATQTEAARRLADTSRIAPAVRFADARGLLAWPVSGEKVLGFGDPDGLGGTTQGLSVATEPGTPVVAPADGWVVYAGPFRSYGQVLILNAGDGYHIVMAGMERIDAALGQFVLAGEPVATMGATRLASIGDFDHTSAQPI
ncbi:MAG TPA: peptidoglycan DD-metalloendopeptidase family protein, partial [Propylenella sp.]|nr:peptidoglycan DD-metalloendopeptidase family protein [Propylenella sp.]